MNDHTPNLMQPVAGNPVERTKQKIYRDFNAAIADIGMQSTLGHVRGSRKITHRVLKSHNCKVGGLMKAGWHHLPVDQVDQMAETLDLTTPFDCQIRRILVSKGSGQYREICKLPYELKAAHYMLGAVIETQSSLVDHVYSRRGRGRDALVSDALNRINTGYNHVSVLDIKKCFGSVNPRVLDTLPVHEKFVLNTLRLENLNFATPIIKQGENQEATIPNQSSVTIVDVANPGGPTGLVQGSPASSPILTWIWKDLPFIDEGLGYVMTFADDVLIVAKTAAGRREIENAVVQFLLSCPAGPLELETRNYEPDETFEFLGYEFRVGREDGSIRAHLSHRTLTKLESVLPKLVELDRQERFDYPYLATEKLNAILRGHRLAVDVDEVERVFLESLFDYNMGAESPFE